MSTVFVVTSGCYSDYRIEAVFSSEELAREFIHKNSASVPEGTHRAEFNDDVEEYWLWAIHGSRPITPARSRPKYVNSGCGRRPHEEEVSMTSATAPLGSAVVHPPRPLDSTESAAPKLGQGLASMRMGIDEVNNRLEAVHEKLRRALDDINGVEEESIALPPSADAKTVFVGVTGGMYVEVSAALVRLDERVAAIERQVTRL